MLFDETSRRVLLRRFADFRDRVLDRIRASNRESERGALETGRALHAVVEAARAYTRRIQTLREHTDESNAHSLTAAIAEQTSQVGEYSTDIGQLIAEQNAEAQQSLQRLQSIANAAREIQRLVNASRMLALNAQVEAARMGEAGKAFAVVAAEMKTFAQEMARANASISTMVDGMQRALPRMAERAGVMEERSQHFAASFQGSVARLEELTAGMQRSISAVIEDGSETLQSVLHQSEAGLSALQFQDPQAQALLYIDRMAHDEQQEMARVVQVHDERLRPSAHLNLGDDGAIHNDASGEVLLF